MGSSPASLRPPSPPGDHEGGFAPRLEQRPESASTVSRIPRPTCLVGLRRSLASSWASSCRRNRINRRNSSKRTSFVAPGRSRSILRYLTPLSRSSRRIATRTAASNAQSGASSSDNVFRTNVSASANLPAQRSASQYIRRAFRGTSSTVSNAADASSGCPAASSRQANSVTMPGRIFSSRSAALASHFFPHPESPLMNAIRPRTIAYRDESLAAPLNPVNAFSTRPSSSICTAASAQASLTAFESHALGSLLSAKSKSPAANFVRDRFARAAARSARRIGYRSARGVDSVRYAASYRPALRSDWALCAIGAGSSGCSSFALRRSASASTSRPRDRRATDLTRYASLRIASSGSAATTSDARAAASSATVGSYTPTSPQALVISARARTTKTSDVRVPSFINDSVASRTS